MSQIEIRQLESDDTELLYNFYQELAPEVHALYRPFEEVTREKIETHLSETDAHKHISWGLWDADRIVGHCFVMRKDDPNPIFGIGLDSRYHGRGYGEKIATEIIDHCDRLDIKNVTLTVLKHNVRAFTLYKKLGFAVHGDQTFKEENDSYFMIRSRHEREDSGGSST